MSVPSELLMNTQNSFHTHAQRGANIVMRGGKENLNVLKEWQEKVEKEVVAEKQQKRWPWSHHNIC